MVYYIIQKSGVSFTLTSDKNPKEMYEAEKGLGPGLAYLWVLEPGRCAEVNPDGSLGPWQAQRGLNSQ